MTKGGERERVETEVAGVTEKLTFLRGSRVSPPGREWDPDSH